MIIMRVWFPTAVESWKASVFVRNTVAHAVWRRCAAFWFAALMLLNSQYFFTSFPEWGHPRWFAEMCLQCDSIIATAFSHSADVNMLKTKLSTTREYLSFIRSIERNAYAVRRSFTLLICTVRTSVHYSSTNGLRNYTIIFVMSIAFCTVRPSYFSLSLLENCLTFLLLNLCPYLPTASQGCKECGLGFLTGNTRVCVGKWCNIAWVCCSNTMIFGPMAVHGIQLWCSVHINGIRQW